MKRGIRIGAVLILAVGSWKMGGIIVDSQAWASHDGAPAPVGETVRRAATESAGLEVRPVEFVATASEEWALPREGASRLQLRTRSGHVRRIRLAPVEGDEIRVHVVHEARVESQEEAGPLLAAMRIEHRREGDAWVVEAGWPYTPRRRRTGPHSYTTDDPRAVTFEFHFPRGVRLDVAHANLSGTDLAGQDLREVIVEGPNRS